MIVFMFVLMFVLMLVFVILEVNILVMLTFQTQAFSETNLYKLPF